MSQKKGHRQLLATGSPAIALLATSLIGRPAYAIDFDIDGWAGSADTTLTASALMRTEAADLKLYGKPYGGTGSGRPGN